ncbi:hypothetical protein [Anabaenopsis elenkinii]|jgi:hypothetical protein|nr:hypothetical protein [Anabaenopsis elenkinii]
MSLCVAKKLVMQRSVGVLGGWVSEKMDDPDVVLPRLQKKEKR